MPTKKQRRASSAKPASRQKLTEAERREAEAKVPPAERKVFEEVIRRLITTPRKPDT